MKRALLILAVVFAFAARIHARSPDTLVIGMELAYPPFEMADEKGEPAGVSVDLAHALGEFLKKKVEIQNLPFDGLIPSLKTNKIDLILSSLTATPERAQSIDFSDPYLKTGLCLLVGKNTGINSIGDVDQKGKTVAVKQGTTGHLYAARQVKNARVLVLDREAACVLEVIQGKADAFIYDQMSVFKNWQENQEMTRALLNPFQQESWAVGVRKYNDELRGQVNAFLKNYRANGGFDRLGDKWLKEQKDAFAKMGIPFFFVVDDAASVAVHRSGLHWQWRRVAAYWRLFASGWKTTIGISLAALGLSTLIGFVIALARRSRFLPLRWFAKVYVELIRGTPLLAQIYVFVYIIADTAHLEDRYVQGVITLSIFSGAYIAEIIRAGIEGVGKSQVESAMAIGLTSSQTYRHVIFPQALRAVLPPLAGQFVSLIKDSSLLSIVGLNELTQNARNVASYTYSNVESYLLLAAGYLVLTLPISLWTRSLEKRFRYET